MPGRWRPRLRVPLSLPLRAGGLANQKKKRGFRRNRIVLIDRKDVSVREIQARQSARLWSAKTWGMEKAVITRAGLPKCQFRQQ